MADVITNLLIFLHFSKALSSITRSETPSSNIMFCRLSQPKNAFLPIVLTDCGTTTSVTPRGKHIKVSFVLLYKAVPSDSKYLLPASTRIDFRALQPEKMPLPEYGSFSSVLRDAGNVIVFNALQPLNASSLMVVTVEGICMSESCSHSSNRP
ncbi:unknown [Prevotella sp. CAG:5226]|nr:unknown [Prevotella sp. CAG:5226]